MHKIDDASAAVIQPTIQPDGPVQNGWFRIEDESLGQSATILTADWLNSIQAEIANVILGAGLTLNKASQNQLFTAIQTLINNVVNDVSPNVLATVTQTGHGFTKGEILYKSGNTWIRAIATSLATSWTLGMVYDVESTATFRVLMLGFISGLTGLTSGTIYYLSTSTPGALQSTRPSTTGLVIKPALIADSATSGYFFNWLPIVAGSGGGGSGDMLAANNLSDLIDIPTARTNLGLGTAALSDATDFLSTADGADFFAITNSFSELLDAPTARTNLGLGSAAVAASADFIPASDYADFAQATDLTAATGDITTLQGAVTTAQTDITNLQSDMTSVQGDITTINGGLSTANGNITTLQGDVTTLQGNLSNYQPLDATLTALAGVVMAANSLIYATGVDTFTTTALTSYARSLLSNSTSAGARTLLGLGTAAVAASTDFAAFHHTHPLTDISDVTATSTQVNYLATSTSDIQTQLDNKQPLDATLTALAGLVVAADKLAYGSGSDTFSLTDFTAFARTLLDDADQATMQATLGLVPGTNVQAHSTILDNTTATYTTALDTKLGGISTGADVTATYLSGTLTGASVATDDKVLIQDTSNSNVLRTVSTQSIANLAGAPVDSIQRLGGGTLSGDAEFIIYGLDGAFLKYLIICTDIKTSTTQANLRMTISTDGGSSWQSAFYSWRAQIASSSDSGTTQSSSNTSDSAWQLIRDIGSGYSQFATIEIFSPNDGTKKTSIFTTSVGLDYAGNSIIQDTMGQYNFAQSNNAVRLVAVSSGTEYTLSMKYVVYGFLAS